MGWILKLLGGSLGPCFAGGIAALLALSVATSGVQTWRISRLHNDLAQARQANINPSTHNTWQSEAVRDGRDLGVCRGSVQTLEGAIARQNDATAALKADGDRRAAMLADALQTARKASVAATKRADAILAVKPKGADACAQLIDLDRQINGG